MTAVVIFGIIMALVVNTLAFFNVSVSYLGHTKRNFDKRFFFAISILTAILFIIVAYVRASSLAVTAMDWYVDGQDPSGVWSLVLTAFIFTAAAVLYATSVYTVSVRIDERHEEYLKKIISRVEKRVIRELDAKYDEKYGDDLESLNDIVRTYALNETDVPNPETIKYLEKVAEEREKEAQKAQQAQAQPVAPDQVLPEQVPPMVQAVQAQA